MFGGVFRDSTNSAQLGALEADFNTEVVREVINMALKL